MKTGSDITELEDFKREAITILEDAKFPVHKWESNIEELDNESNPSKILGHGIKEKSHLRSRQNQSTMKKHR